MMTYGRYEVIHELGKGTMGVVYFAKDPRIDRFVALKVLRPDYAGDEYFVQRFFKEAVAIGRLSHSHIVTIYDVGQDQETIYIAMELVEGRPLSDLIRDNGLDLPTAVRIATQVADALNYSHSKGIVHRDIKPANIIMTGELQAKITDFGIAHIEDVSASLQTHAGEILGTPVYMSPEQVLGKMPDGRSDLYSLGVVLYEMTTGKRPFTGPSMAVIFNAVIQDIPMAPAALNPAVPKDLSDCILKSLEKEPDRRFQSGQEMIEALEACIRVPAPSIQVSSIPSPWPKRISLAGGTLFLVTGLALGLRYFDLPRDTVNLPAGSQERSAAPEPAVPPPPIAREEPPPLIPPVSTETRSKIVPQPTETVTVKKAQLKLDSDPPGAQVYINGTLRGRTPLNIALPLGKQEVRMQLEDFYNWEGQINLDKVGETPVFVKLNPVVF